MKGILFRDWKIKFIAKHPDMEIMARRVIKPQPVINEINDKWVVNTNHGVYWWWLNEKSDITLLTRLIKPRYQVGETVYIKEAWAADKKYDHLMPSELPSGLSLIYPYGGDPEDDIRFPSYGRIRSPLHLRAEDARYFIKIVAVRAERLQEITSEGCQDEGITIPAQGDTSYYIKGLLNEFRRVWNSINKEKWEDNPWVWVYGFKWLK